MKTNIIENSPIPKHCQMANLMMAEIKDGKYKPGSKFLSEHEWAKRFGLSRQTVRQALGRLQRDGYLKCEQGRGTFVTVPLRLTESTTWSQSRDIGVLVSCVTRYSEMIRAVEDVCRENGCHVMIGSTDLSPQKERSYIKEWVAKPLAGVVAYASYNSRQDDYRPFIESGVPLVLVDTRIDGVDADVVCADNEKGALEGTRKLIEKGCRRIAYVSGYFSASPSRERLEGYRMALEEAGIPFDRSLVAEGAFSIPAGHEGATRLLSEHHDVDGIFSSNPTIAEGVVYAVLDKWFKIPDHINICSFGEPALPPAWHLPLVIVKEDFAVEAQTAARLLLARIAAMRRGEKSVHYAVHRITAEVAMASKEDEAQKELSSNCLAKMGHNHS